MTDSNVAKARRIARMAHRGQLDKRGEPYLWHVTRVAEAVRGDERAEQVAWLHDVVEDTVLTVADLEVDHFEPEVLHAVEAITRNPVERYGDYLARVKRNPLATRVKLADLKDNMDPSRRFEGDAYLLERYRRGIRTLESMR